MKKYDWKTWLYAAGIRAVKTVAETAIGLIGTSLTIADVHWSVVLSASLLSGLVSILISIKGLPELDAQQELVQLKETK